MLLNGYIYQQYTQNVKEISHIKGENTNIQLKHIDYTADIHLANLSSQGHNITLFE